MLDGENKLIERAVRGESSAFGLLYDHYQPHIYRFVVVKVSHREEAEDITHQVFLHAWQHIGSYMSLGFPFSSWLYRIAKNQVIDHYRTRRHTSSLEDLDAEHIPETGDDHATRLDRVSEVATALAAVRMLKEDHQDVIMMRFIQELSIRETAEAMGKSPGAVKLMQHRAIKELKQLLTTNE